MSVKLLVGLISFLAIGLVWAFSSLESSQQQGASGKPLLNSERIWQKFGSYGIDVLEQGPLLRISSLYSVQNGVKVTRTLAVVIYPEVIPDEIAAEHEAIRGGGSMGEVFKQSGWAVEKGSLYVGEIPASPDFGQIYQLMGDRAASPLAVHLYELSVCKEAACFPYATLAEVHSPDYMSLADLEAVYGSAQGINASQDLGVQESLDLVLAAMAEQF